ncbi:GntR family transcriptional regulator [Actinoallomurus oryzae]|uniref:GntR family transcriptional regulator n=2 Tax=Actinoallomurus oryzae TaxID=502180 RepID=A0ABP8RA43_9ACTN
MAPSPDPDAPLYMEIANELRMRIANGDLPAGAAVPTEQALVDQYKVSRNTIRNALRELSSQGLITSGQGRTGRRVRNNRPITFHGSQSESIDRADERRVTGVDAWVADVREEGREPSQTIAAEIVNASAAIARCLAIDEGTPVVARRRLRTVDGEPHNLADTYYPLDIAEGTPIMYPDDVAQGVIALMREMGYVQVRYRDELSWRMPTPKEIRTLDIPVGIPVLVQARTGYTKERPVKVTVTTWPGDRARMVYELPA